MARYRRFPEDLCRGPGRRPGGLLRRLAGACLLVAGSAFPVGAAEPVGLEPSRLSLSLSGFVQADVYAYRQDSQDQLDNGSGQPLNETRFLIRRARLRAQAEARALPTLPLGVVLELDGSTVSGAQARLLGAEVWAAWAGPTEPRPWLSAGLGLFKIPFGREVQEYDPDRVFLERSRVVQALFPGEYDLGLRLHGAFRFLRYAVALMNGAPAGDVQFALRDPNRSKDLLGRVGIDAAPWGWLALRVGVSGLWGTGFSPGSPATKDSLSWRDDNDDGQVQLSELLPLRGRAAVPSQDFSRDALAADAQLVLRLPVVGALTLAAEILWARNLDRGLSPADPVAAGRDLRELGYYLSIVGELSRYGLWGLRYDHYDPDADSQQQSGLARVPVSLAFSTLTATAGVTYPGLARLSIEYQHNQNGLGRGPGGLPTTLGRDALLLRAQGGF
ncbi:MAG TPA: hypothetical protein PKI03_04760 [Pseudomonadota bacterium]|nr:hypothetical protein [Pseudomonadota bacterium]